MKKVFSILTAVTVLVAVGSCSHRVIYGSKTEDKYEEKDDEDDKPTEPCIAERIDGGVRITCPTSEAIVYDGETGSVGAPGMDGQDGQDGTNGSSCFVQSDGLIRCGNSTYQLPVVTSDECQVFILPKE